MERSEGFISRKECLKMINASLANQTAMIKSVHEILAMQTYMLEAMRQLLLDKGIMTPKEFEVYVVALHDKYEKLRKSEGKDHGG